MNNLSTVIKFEITRALKKPGFWIMAILVPIVLIVMLGVATWAGYSGTQIIESGASTEDLTVALIDESGLISENPAVDEIAKNIEFKTDLDSAIEQVKAGEINVLYFVPAEISTENAIKIYTNTENNSLFASYTANIQGLLTTSAMVGLNQNQINIFANQINIETHTFIDGAETNIFGKMVIPIVGLVIFYILICLFGNRLMMSTLEEKENRISEMILTAIGSKTLIVGKIISLITLGFLQVLILLVPMVVFYFAVGGMNVAGINISDILPGIVFDPLTIIYTLLLLIFSYILFTGLCVLVGVIMPTAKEAGGFMGVLMMMIVSPFFFFTSFIAPEPIFIVKFLSLFPFSAPVALSIRNAFGTLPVHEAIIGLVIIIALAAAIITIAIKLFRTSAMSYDSRVKFFKAFKKNKVSETNPWGTFEGRRER